MTDVWIQQDTLRPHVLNIIVGKEGLGSFQGCSMSIYGIPHPTPSPTQKLSALLLSCDSQSSDIRTISSTHKVGQEETVSLRLIRALLCETIV